MPTATQTATKSGTQRGKCSAHMTASWTYPTSQVPIGSWLSPKKVVESEEGGIVEAVVERSKSTDLVEEIFGKWGSLVGWVTPSEWVKRIEDEVLGLDRVDDYTDRFVKIEIGKPLA